MHVTVNNEFGLDVSEQEIIDFCDMFTDADVSLTVNIAGRSGKKGRRGDASCVGKKHVVNLYVPAIEDSFKLLAPAGGNVTVPSSVREGLFFVLAHELRHVQQHVKHKSNRAYWSGSYRRRACEIDARSFVDRNERLIVSFVNPETFDVGKRRAADVSFVQEIEALVDLLSHAGDISDDELRAELGASGMNNPQAFSIARSMLDDL